MRGWPGDESPYHEGERSFQAQVGVRERAESMGRRMIRDFMPDQHRALFTQLPLVLVGSLDRAGRPWASVSFGPPGFVTSPDARTLRVDARVVEGDPLADGLTVGSPLGLLGIQLETRRRNRANGRVEARDEHGFTLRVEQSFGNCPQYIQARAPRHVDDRKPGTPRREGARLGAAAARCIEASDTCFVASASGPTPGSDAREGVDVSHRGGRPGFVRVELRGDAHVLTLPDFAGNRSFNTLGNLHAYPRAGLLFVDFATGDLLSITCTATIVREGDDLARFSGAERLVVLRVEEGRWLPRALPLDWSSAEPAPQLAQTGSWRAL